MLDFVLDHIYCTGCLGLKFAPGHLVRRFVFGMNCDQVQ